MKEYFTTSDIGALTIGNFDFRFNLPNRYGDGENIMYVFDTEEEFNKFQKVKRYRDKFKWMGRVEGKFKIYYYDCAKGYAEDEGLQLEGSFNIYNYNYYETPIFAIVPEV